MTIAACYVSPEGVVLGADSATTYTTRVGEELSTRRHYNYAQKVFEIGSQSSLGVVMWGMGSLGQQGYRTLIARLGDQLEQEPATSVQQVAEQFAQLFWAAYSSEYESWLKTARELAAAQELKPDQARLLTELKSKLSGGFCVGGWCLPERKPLAYEITYTPIQPAPKVREIPMGRLAFWGVPDFLHRLFHGADRRLVSRILKSGKWSGTQEELLQLVGKSKLSPPGHLPIREAIDWVHSSIGATIKALKFSTLNPICGGPTEVAVITSDRPFRWVTHKSMDAAINAWSTQETPP